MHSLTSLSSRNSMKTRLQHQDIDPESHQIVYDRLVFEIVRMKDAIRSFTTRETDERT